VNRSFHDHLVEDGNDEHHHGEERDVVVELDGVISVFGVLQINFVVRWFFVQGLPPEAHLS